MRGSVRTGGIDDSPNWLALPLSFFFFFFALCPFCLFALAIATQAPRHASPSLAWLGRHKKDCIPSAKTQPDPRVSAIAWRHSSLLSFFFLASTPL